MKQMITSWFRRYFSDPEAISIVVVLVLCVLAVKTMGYVLAPIIISIVIAYMLGAVVRLLESLRFSRWLAQLVAFCVFIGAVVLILVWLLPLLWTELANLFAAAPGMIGHGEKILLGLQTKYPAFISTAKLQQFFGSWDAHGADLGKVMLSFSLASISGLVNFAVYFVLVPFLVFFFLKDGQVILSWFGSFLPKKRTVLQQLWLESNRKVGSYVKGKAIEMVLVALVSVFLFAVMRLDYAVLLGALVGVSVLVPYVGVVLVTIPVVLVAVMEWGWSGHLLYLVIAYAIVVALDANVLVPILFAEAMALHPVVIILAVLVFGSLGGFWGVFFAIPLATLAHTLLRAWPKTK